MTEEQKRLEKILLEIIEEIKNEPTPESIKVIPGAAHELIELWKI